MIWNFLLWSVWGLLEMKNVGIVEALNQNQNQNQALNQKISEVLMNGRAT